MLDIWITRGWCRLDSKSEKGGKNDDGGPHFGWFLSRSGSVSEVKV